MEQNYRSTKRILRVAAELIAHNVKRKEKALFTENGEGVPVRLVPTPPKRTRPRGSPRRSPKRSTPAGAAPAISPSSTASTPLSRALEFALREQGVPYQMVNGLEFFQRKEIKDILAYLHLLNNPQDDVALLRVINAPPRGIGKTTIERLSDYAAGHGLPLAGRAGRDAARGQVQSVRSRDQP